MENNTIQKARDVLAKWRKEATAGTWLIDADDSFGPDQIDINAPGNVAVGTTYREENARLIVGTAGNPDLLDALDAFLAQELRRRTSMHDNMSHDLSHHATRIAAAIIAAEERMSA